MMSDEDQELILEMLLKLDESQDSIRASSKWCRANATFHEEIVHMWFFAVAKAQTQRRRLYLFYLASDILFTAEPTSIQYFSSFLPQLYKAIPFVRGEDIRADMKKLFKLWREKKIYNKAIMKRLNRMLKNKNKVVDNAIFKYDKDLLFKNLKRVGDIHPACDYLARGVEFAPSFDNSQALLSTIKERKACQALLATVDAHKVKVTSLVSYMEEMVHLLKMATTTLDLAGNKEQNGVEETKIRIMAYGTFESKIKGVLGALESKWGLKREDYAKPITPASPEPEEENLYSRRVGTVGVPGDPRLANVPVPPIIIPAVPVVTPPVNPIVPVIPPVVASWLPVPQNEDVFHRRSRAGSMTPRRDGWQDSEDIPFANPAPPRELTDEVPFVCPRPPRDDLPFVSPRPPRDELPFVSPRPPRDDLPFVSPRPPKDDLPFVSPRPPKDDLPFVSPRPPRDDLPFVSPRARREDLPFASPRANVAPVRDTPWRTPRLQRSTTPTLDEPRERREDPWDTPRPRRVRDEPWSPQVHQQDDLWERHRPASPWEPWSPRPVRDQPFDTPRPHTSREEPWERSRGLTPTRDELWDRPRGTTPTQDEPWSPVSPLHTGGSQWGPTMKKPVYMPCYTGFHLESPREGERRRSEPLLPDPPRRKPLLAEPLGIRPPIQSPAASQIPSLTSFRADKRIRNRR